MSEVVEKPSEIVPAKSEDKLEIEKEEQEEKVEEGSSEKEGEAKKEENAESAEKGETSAEKGEKDVTDSEKKEPETSDEKEKKFSMPKIKTPKIIKEIRSRSKSREKKKKKDDTEETPAQESEEDKKEEKKEEAETKEQTVDKNESSVEKEGEKESEEKDKTEESKEKEADGKSEETSEKKDVVKEAKSKVKDALDSIHLPKMPKMHKPAFMKKKPKEESEKDGEESKEKKTEEAVDGEETKEEPKEKTEESEEKKEETTEEKKEQEKEEKKEEKEEEKCDEKKTEDDETEKKDQSEKNEEGVEEKKHSLIDSIKSIKAPKMPKIFSKNKKGETDLESGKCDESEQLLEETDSVVGDEKDAGESEPKEKQGTSILKSIRNVASGVPALFKKESTKGNDVESGGEKEDLLEKKEERADEKPDELKMEDIKLDDEEKKDELDNKSQGSEKKDPEKGDEDPEKGGEVMEEKSKMDRLKRLPSDAVRQVSNLDKRKIYGIVGILVGLLLLVLVIIIAAVAPRGWRNHHKLVEGGKYIETETGCGKVWGWVEGDDKFLFRSIPYSVDVERFSHSRLPATVDECGDEIKHPNNESRVCMRRTLNGLIGEEDCLTLDIATSSVVYDSPAPVVVYVGGDDDKLVPSSELAKRQGVVFVTVSVRQGVLGYLSHNLLSESEKPPTSGNYAVGDLITALKWVQLNIRHFGGNPDMVTLLGHQQGASLVTVLTAVEEGHGLYQRIWATGGAGFIEMLSLEDSSSQFNDIVTSVCKDGDRDCLLEVDAEELVGKVEEEAESWNHSNLPSRGEKSMMSWVTLDTQLFQSSLSAFWKSSQVSVPAVFGAAAQSEANSVNYQLYDWNNTDQVESIVESSLGIFDVSIATGALDLYNSSNNWLEYISMVSDIRTVCPMRHFANIFQQNYTASEVSFYVAQETSPLEDDESGNVADSSTDISAIFGLYEDQDFGNKLQSKFFQFVTGKIDKLGEDVTVFDKEDAKDSDERCSFWMKTSEEIVPQFAKRF